MMLEQSALVDKIHLISEISIFDYQAIAKLENDNEHVKIDAIYQHGIGHVIVFIFRTIDDLLFFKLKYGNV